MTTTDLSKIPPKPDSTGTMCIECGLKWAIGGENPLCKECDEEMDVYE
jgi:hypothetical protein